MHLALRDPGKFGKPREPGLARKGIGTLLSKPHPRVTLGLTR